MANVWFAHGWHHGGAGWPGWFFGIVGMVLFWGLVIWILLTVTRTGWWRSKTDGSQRSAEQILAERFARGEISEQDYQDRLRVLRDSHRS